MDELTKHAFGRHHLAVDISAAAYAALVDGKSRSIPFQINLTEPLTLSVKMVDDAAFANHYFNAGDNPDLIVAIAADAVVAAGIVTVVYPYLPAVTTISV